MDRADKSSSKWWGRCFSILLCWGTAVSQNRQYWGGWGKSKEGSSGTADHTRIWDGTARSLSLPGHQSTWQADFKQPCSLTHSPLVGGETWRLQCSTSWACLLKVCPTQLTGMNSQVSARKIAIIGPCFKWIWNVQFCFILWHWEGRKIVGLPQKKEEI